MAFPTFFIVWIFLTLTCTSMASDREIHSPAQDRRTFMLAREGLSRALEFARSRPDLFAPGKEEKEKLLSREEKMLLWTTWSSVLNSEAALDAVRRTHKEFDGIRNKSGKNEAQPWLRLLSRRLPTLVAASSSAFSTWPSPRNLPLFRRSESAAAKARRSCGKPLPKTVPSSGIWGKEGDTPSQISENNHPRQHAARFMGGMKLSTSNAAVELLTRNLELHPDKVAYFCGDRTLSYRELGKASRRFAHLLRKRGIAPGESVLIVLPDCFAFPVAFLGCLLSGAMAVAIDAAIREEDFAHVIEDCGARLLVTHAELAALSSVIGDKIKVIVCGDDGPPEDSITCDDVGNPYQPLDDDFAYMLYSSGSTGKPKGVPHRHKSLLLPCDLLGEALWGITGDDVIFSTSKFPFAYGLINSLAFPLRFGATAILHPGKPDPRAVLDTVRRRKPSIFFSVPTMYAHIILSCAERELKLPMRLCCSAGEVLPAPVFEEWQRLTGMEILDGIGSTEMSYHFISNIPGRAVAGSAGRLVPGYRARLVDDDGNDVPAGNEGHLLVSGDTRSPFYWNLPVNSAETMLPDGFIRTGDIFVERNGFFYHRGRSDDMIKAGACWVSPVIVEEALRSHPAVADCAVAAVSAGTLVKPGAFVVLVPGTERTPGLALELRTHIMARLPDYMCPVRFRFMEDLPRTSTGKIQRFRLSA